MRPSFAEWEGALRRELVALLPLCDGDEVVGGPVRQEFADCVEAVFSGRRLAIAALQRALTASLYHLWNGRANGIAAEPVAALLGRLVGLCAACPDTAPYLPPVSWAPPAETELRAHAAVPVTYVLQERDWSDDSHALVEAPPVAVSVVSLDDAVGGAEEGDPGVLLVGPCEPTPPQALTPTNALEAVRTMEEFFAVRVADCLGTASLLLQHREQRFLREALGEEQRLATLLDCVASTGSQSVRLTRHVALEHLGEWEEWTSALLFLGCTEGEAASLCLNELVEMVPPDALDAVAPLVQALSRATASSTEALLRHWLDGGSPVARAVAAETLVRRGSLAAEQAWSLLLEPVDSMQQAVLRGMRVTPIAGFDAVPWRSFMPLLWRYGSASLAMEAVTTAAWSQSGEAFRAWRRGELAHLEGREMDLLLLFGGAEDRGAVSTLLERTTVTPHLLKQVGQWGDAAHVPLLIEALSDEALTSAAGEALERILGRAPYWLDRELGTYWHERVAHSDLSSAGRLWVGGPHGLAPLAGELSLGTATLRDLEAFLLECRIRYGIALPTAVTEGWLPAGLEIANQWARAAQQVDGAGRGFWHQRTAGMD